MTDPRPVLERLTKPTIVLSLFVAAWKLLSVVPFQGMTALAFVLAWAAGRFRPVLARRVAMFTTYLVPIVFVTARGRFVEANWLVWVAIVCGLMFSTPAPMRWSLPDRWKLPLVFWGVLAACTWPLVAFREADFLPSQLWLGGWSATVAMGTMVGILWFDWLFSTYGQPNELSEASLETEILLPLGLGWALGASIGLYQMFGQVSALNPGFWVSLRRATGSLGDANVFGVISAMWGPALVAASSTLPGRWTRWWVAAIVLPLSWMALWGSGSRSSLLIAVPGLLAVLVGLWRSTQSKRMLVAAFAMLVIVASGAAAVTRGGALAVGPLSRFAQDFAPDWSGEWARRTATRLWVREGYGTIAIEMIRQSPLVGIGQSAYYDLVYPFSSKLLGAPLPYDNAQNWFRHKLAELGVVGSLGWIVWTGSFLFLLLTARARADRRLSGPVVRAVLVGFGLVSLLGMPGQSLVVGVTFWTLAFWFLRDMVTGPGPNAAGVTHSRLAWAGLWLLVIGHTAGTAYVGWKDFRPPVRAQWAGLNYSLGIYAPRGEPHYEEFHWAKQRAVAVVAAPKQWLELTVAVSHADIQQKPVDVRVWLDRRLMVRARVRTVEPITRYIRVSDAPSRVMLETWTSRVVYPGGFENGEPRELGLLIRWTFVDAPPPGATIATIE